MYKLALYFGFFWERLESYDDNSINKGHMFTGRLAHHLNRFDGQKFLNHWKNGREKLTRKSFSFYIFCVQKDQKVTK